jgi:hypothetical protein
VSRSFLGGSCLFHENVLGVGSVSEAIRADAESEWKFVQLD